jgi:hypothetical protein
MNFALYPKHHLTPALSPTSRRRGRRSVGSTKVRGFNVLVGSLALFGRLVFSASAALPSVEKLLPEDTLAMVTTPDFTKARAAYYSAPQSQLWNDPALKPFKDKLLAKMNENLLQPLEKDLGIKFDDYTNLAQGQITLAVTQNGWPTTEGSKPGVLFLLDTRNQSGQLTKNLADLRKKWLEAGKSLRTEKIRNIDFSVVPVSDKDVPKTIKKFSGPDLQTDTDESATNAPKTELYIGQSESLLIIGTAPKPIEKVLVHVSGGEMPSLGDLALYQGNRLALFRDSPLYGWVNTKSLIDLLGRRPASEDADTADPFALLNPTKILSAIGLSSLKTVAFSVQIANDASTVQFFASMPESSRQGIFKVIPGEAKDSAPPSFVPADAVKFQRTRIDGKKAWDTFQKVLADVFPSAKGAISFAIDTANAAAKEKDPDFDLNKNLFGNLGDDMISYEKAPRGTSLPELNSPPSLFLLGSPNPDKIVASFKYVLLLLNPQGGAPKEREFLGRKIYTTPLPGAAASFGAKGSGSAPTLSYAASGGYVVFSSDASMIEEYLRSSDSQQKALRETPGLTDAIAKAGGSSTGMLGYENQAETTRALFEALRNTAPTATGGPSPGAMMLGLSSLPNAASFKDWMDFSLLPPFDKISKYFGISVYTLSSTPDGVLLKMYSPVPAALRK